MSVVSDLSEQGWLKVFFSGRNRLRWDDIEAQTLSARPLALVTPWIKKLKAELYDGPLVLPLYEEDDRITWYAMAADDHLFSQMIDELTGFVGASYSDFLGEWAQLSLDDPCERALAERFDQRVVKFSANMPSDQAQIETALALYASCIERRPEIPDRTQRPFGKIRSDFDIALLAGNADQAQVYLEEIVSSGRVNAEQHKCLEIRLLAGLGRKEELAKNTALIASVSDVLLPSQIIVDITTALYETFIEPIESASELKNVIDIFKRSVLKPFGGIFRERKGIRHPKVLRAFLLSELAISAPDMTRCNSFLAAYPENADGYQLALAWYKSLAQAIRPLPDRDAQKVCLEQAIQAIADEDYEIASSRCFELLPMPWAYGALLRCALELNSVGLRERVLQTFSDASQDILLKLNDKDRSRLEKLLSPGVSGNTSRTKSSWLGWAQQVLEAPSRAPTVAELQDMAVKWSVDEYAKDATLCETLANYLVDASGEAQDIFRDAFPVLVDFFESVSGAQRPFRPIYSVLIKFLGWSGKLSSDELEIGSQIMQALLLVGPSESDYTEAIEDLREILAANASPAIFDWSLNLAEMLAYYPTPDHGASKLHFFTDVIGMLRSAYHRVTPLHRNLLVRLSQDYDCNGLLATFPEGFEGYNNSIVQDVLIKGLVGIYTLTESAGLRAKEVLEKIYPSIKVELNSDQVATDRLIALAKNSDIFVFAWKSSKHQAFFCVKEARKNQEILLPSGKGSASILTSVLQRIPDLTH